MKKYKILLNFMISTLNMKWIKQKKSLKSKMTSGFKQVVGTIVGSKTRKNIWKL